MPVSRRCGISSVRGRRYLKMSHAYPRIVREFDDEDDEPMVYGGR